MGSRYCLAEGPAGRDATSSRFIIPPEYCSFSLREKYIARLPLRSYPLSLFLSLPSFSPRSSRIPRKRGYPSIRRRVPIANEKSCSVAFNSMCRATRATISTRSINRVSCSRISISGCLVDEHLYSRFLFDLKESALSLSLSLSVCVFISHRRGITSAPSTVDFAFQRFGSVCVKEMFEIHIIFRIYNVPLAWK